MEFRDLKRQYDILKPEIDEAISNVICDAHFISGPQVRELEGKLADYVGVKHCISCGNGTDAISIMLMAHGVGEAGGGNKNDAVFVPDFTFFSTGECPATCGATPVFVDVKRDTYNMDPEALEKAIHEVLEKGELIPRAVIAVDLFGLPAEYDALSKICREYDILLLEDGAQGFGGMIVGKRACSFGYTSTTSFFPAKPLGCYGDGGAIFTDDDDIDKRCRSISVHGKDMGNPSDANAKYNNVRLGMNSRLDTLQAAILLVKMKAFINYELNDINKVAGWYNDRLAGIEGLAIPRSGDDYCSSWAQYTVQLPANADRRQVQAGMKDAGIPTMIYYAKPLHRQRAFAETLSSGAECPMTDYLCEHVLSLPIHPYMTEDEVETVTKSLIKCLK